MKKFLLVQVAVVVSTCCTQAQAFQKGRMVNNVYVGGARYWHVGNPDDNPFDNGFFTYSPSLVFNWQLEIPIHEYVGLGPIAGVGVSFYRWWGNDYNVVSIPVGMYGNFHFYQLIADKVSADLHADQLDIYAGVNFVAGPAFGISSNNTSVFATITGGPQLGVRWYPNAGNIGIAGEYGFGKSFAQLGICIRSK